MASKCRLCDLDFMETEHPDRHRETVHKDNIEEAKQLASSSSIGKPVARNRASIRNRSLSVVKQLTEKKDRDHSSEDNWIFHRQGSCFRGAYIHCSHCLYVGTSAAVSLQE